MTLLLIPLLLESMGGWTQQLPVKQMACVKYEASSLQSH